MQEKAPVGLADEVARAAAAARLVASANATNMVWASSPCLHAADVLL